MQNVRFSARHNLQNLHKKEGAKGINTANGCTALVSVQTRTAPCGAECWQAAPGAPPALAVPLCSPSTGAGSRWKPSSSAYVILESLSLALCCRRLVRITQSTIGRASNSAPVQPSTAKMMGALSLASEICSVKAEACSGDKDRNKDGVDGGDDSSVESSDGGDASGGCGKGGGGDGADGSGVEGVGGGGGDGSGDGDGLVGGGCHVGAAPPPPPAAAPPSYAN